MRQACCSAPNDIRPEEHCYCCIEALSLHPAHDIDNTIAACQTCLACNFYIRARCPQTIEDGSIERVVETKRGNSMAAPGQTHRQLTENALRPIGSEVVDAKKDFHRFIDTVCNAPPTLRTRATPTGASHG